jgi:hemerythrin-like domain-containing protein
MGLTIGSINGNENPCSERNHSMSLQIGEPASPTFRQPLALLSDCHRRVEKFLGLLIRVAHEADGGPLNPPQREALETSLRYFREAAPKHTADEEDSLFPRLRGLGTPEAEALMEKVAALEDDHATAGLDHDAVELFGRLWLARNRLDGDEVASLHVHLESLRALYVHHIRVEDTEVLPAAGQLLAEADLAEVGREMAARRGQPFERPGFSDRTRPTRDLDRHATA